MKKQGLGSRIKDLRESRNMTQAELAKLLFVSDKTRRDRGWIVSQEVKTIHF